MSDLLARLVDRAFDVGGGLRPRLAARYEEPGAVAPRATSADWRPDDPPGGVEEERPPERRPAQRQVRDVPSETLTPSHAEVPRAGVRPSDALRPPAPATARDAPRVSPVTRTGGRPAPDPASFEEFSREPSSRAPMRRPSRAGPPPAPVELPAGDLPSASRAEPVAGPPARLRAPAPSPALTAQVDAVTQPGQATRAAPPVAHSRTVATPETSVSPDPASVEPPFTRVAERRPAPLSAPRHEQPVDADAWPGPSVGRATRPVVRVSIGRIEVRALTSPAPPVQSADPPRTGAPSLEEYLRSRNGTAR